MTDVDIYLSKLSGDNQKALQHFCNIVRSTVPDATETTSYGLPTFNYKGKYLIAFAQFTQHLGMYPGAEAIVQFDAELAGFSLSKGTIRFTPDHPLPDDLVIKIIRTRQHAIDAKP